MENQEGRSKYTHRLLFPANYRPLLWLRPVLPTRTHSRCNCLLRGQELHVLAALSPGLRRRFINIKWTEELDICEKPGPSCLAVKGNKEISCKIQCLFKLISRQHTGSGTFRTSLYWVFNSTCSNGFRVASRHLRL